MSYYHIIIATEKRQPTIMQTRKEYVGRIVEETGIDEDGEEYPAERWLDINDPDAWVEREYPMPNPRLANPISQAVATGNTVQGPMGEMPEYVAGPAQLHTIGKFPGDITNDQFVMVAEWDGSSPYVICHKGDYSARTMGYAGWPDMTKEQYDALPAADPL